MKPTLIILAAGMGSRYGGLKQLDGLGPSGETIMDYTIYDAIKAGFGKVVFVIRREFEEDFRDAVLKKVKSTISTELVFQDLDDLPQGLSPPVNRKKPWGTAHALWVCRNAVDTPFAMVNADDFYGRSSLKIISQHLSETPSDKMAACLVGYELENTLSDYGSVSRGICQTDEEGYLEAIEERTEIIKENGQIIYQENGERYHLTGQEIASMNLTGFSPDVFDVIEEGFISFFKNNAQKPGAEYYVADVLKILIENGLDIPVLPTSSEWFGVTYQQDKEVVQDKLQRLHRQGIYPPKLFHKNMDEAVKVIEHFQITGTPTKAESFGDGHIHETFKINTLEPSQLDYLLQKINQHVFKDVDTLMENIYKVTEHIKSKEESGSPQVLTIIPSKSGRLYYLDNESCWRVFEFIGDTESHERAKTEKQAFEAARMFGLFLRDLSDFPLDELNITIPNFHNIEFRLRQFNDALSAAKQRYIKKARQLIQAVQQSAPIASELYESASAGDLPLRVTHNDTKFNNILLDSHGCGCAVVDLDTVMPGYVFYDVGDGIRTGTVTAGEDEQNLDLVNIDGPKYDAYLKGYLNGAGGILTNKELESMSLAGFYMAFIMGVRFLTDYLMDNEYYQIDFADHNYYRARCQLHVAELLREKVSYTQKLVREYQA